MAADHLYLRGLSSESSHVCGRGPAERPAVTQRSRRQAWQAVHPLPTARKADSTVTVSVTGGPRPFQGSMDIRSA
jgi:hypothetical protein